VAGGVCVGFEDGRGGGSFFATGRGGSAGRSVSSAEEPRGDATGDTGADESESPSPESEGRRGESEPLLDTARGDRGLGEVDASTSIVARRVSSPLLVLVR
jgi:hypothetical protein